MVWEAVFLLLILKIPVVYLGCVVWWAIRAKPEPPEGALVTAPVDPEPRPAWTVLRRGSRRTRPRPHGSPGRRFVRAPLPASWQAAGWRAPE